MYVCLLHPTDVWRLLPMDMRSIGSFSEFTYLSIYLSI